MIPLVDDYIQLFIAEKLKWLKQHPAVIEQIFHTGKRETLKKLRDFIENQKIKVIIGYPKDQTSLPCYVITLAPENEQPVGLGDDGGYFDEYDLGITSEDEEIGEAIEKKLSEFLATTYMNSNYRIECWSDNGDLTSYMYIILKWCLWTSRQQMLNMGWVNIKVNGTDLEPVPDYMPVFIYRRAAQINLMYENLYYEELENVSKFVDNPDDYHKDDDGNIVNKDDEIVIPAKYTWILRAHYYEKSTGDEVALREYKNDILTSDKSTLESSKNMVLDELPDTGVENIVYFIRETNDFTGEEFYSAHLWAGDRFIGVGSFKTDLSQFATIDVVDKKDQKTLKKAETYTDNKEYTAEDVGLEEMGDTSISSKFNSIFG